MRRKGTNRAMENFDLGESLGGESSVWGLYLTAVGQARGALAVEVYASDQAVLIAGLAPVDRVRFQQKKESVRDVSPRVAPERTGASLHFGGWRG